MDGHKINRLLMRMGQSLQIWLFLCDKGHWPFHKLHHSFGTLVSK